MPRGCRGEVLACKARKNQGFSHNISTLLQPPPLVTVLGTLGSRTGSVIIVTFDFGDFFRFRGEGKSWIRVAIP